MISLVTVRIDYIESGPISVALCPAGCADSDQQRLACAPADPDEPDQGQLDGGAGRGDAVAAEVAGADDGAAAAGCATARGAADVEPERVQGPAQDGGGGMPVIHPDSLRTE